MTVATTATFSGPFVPNGVTTVFPFAFKAFTAAEVSVHRIDTAGVETVVDAASYEVTVGDPGGNVTFVVAPAAGGTLVIISEPLFTQEITLKNQGAFLPEVLNEIHDRDVVRDLYLRGQLGRTVRVPNGETGPVFPGSTARAGTLLSFNSFGTPESVIAKSRLMLVSGGGPYNLSPITGQSGVVTIAPSGAPVVLPLSSFISAVPSGSFNGGPWDQSGTGDSFNGGQWNG